MMSSSRSLTSVRSSRPSFTYTWQVEQAHTPPQAEPTWASHVRAASRNEVPVGTSTSIPSGSKRTFGMRSPVRVAGAAVRLRLLQLRLHVGQRLARQPALERQVHAPLGERLAGGVQRLDGGADGQVIAARLAGAQLRQRGGDGGAVLVGQQLGRGGHGRGGGGGDALGLHPLL